MNGLTLALQKRFPDFRIDIHLTVQKGELLTLLGPSGCGKTTSLRLIAGFLDPDSGNITMEGRLLNPLPPQQRKIGIVFQDYALFPHLNVGENIAFGPRMQGWSRAEIEPRIEELLGLVHLQGYRHRKVSRLSGGEQQRVALARALAPNPHLLLLDEPLSALDAKLRKNLRQEIRRIQQELELTTVYITHDQEEALAISDRIAVMNQGCIEQIGTPREIYTRPANLFVAGFVGRANLISGRIIDLAHGTALLRTALGDLRAVFSVSPQAGSEMSFFFRPEHCHRIDEEQKHPRSGQSDNCFHGVVVAQEYRGDNLELKVDTGEQILLLNLADTDPIDTGTSIDFSVNERLCRLLN